MLIRTATLLTFAWLSDPSLISAQQVFEILVDSGRTIVGSIEHDFGHVDALDHSRGLIYVAESRDPYIVEARSLDDGSVRGRYGRGRGEGPGEVEQVVALAAGPDGVLVSGGRAVNYWTIAGDLEFAWIPEAPGADAVCVFGGQATVPLHPRGVAVRTPEGSSRAVGAARASRSLNFPELREMPTRSEVLQASLQFMSRKLACSNDTAYVLREDDVLTAYAEDEPPREIPLPAELVDQARRRQEANRGGRYAEAYTAMTLDSDGRLFVTQWNQRFAGAVIDPMTGAYRLLRDNAPYRNSRWYVGMYRDSVVATRAEPTTEIINGRPTTVVYAEPSHISIYPVRAVSDSSGRGGHDG